MLAVHESILEPTLARWGRPDQDGELVPSEGEDDIDRVIALVVGELADLLDQAIEMDVLPVLDDQDAVVEHLDEALDRLLAARIRVGGLVPNTAPVASLEAAARSDDNYRAARQQASDAVQTLLAAVELDEQVVGLLLAAESAWMELLVVGGDLGWRLGAMARRE